MYSVPHYTVHICQCLVQSFGGPRLIVNSSHFSPNFKMDNSEKVESDVPPDQLATLSQHLATSLGSSSNILSAPSSVAVTTGSVCRFFLNSVTRGGKILTFGHISKFSFGD